MGRAGGSPYGDASPREQQDAELAGEQELSEADGCCWSQAINV